MCKKKTYNFLGEDISQLIVKMHEMWRIHTNKYQIQCVCTIT